MNIYSYSTETYRYKRDIHTPNGIVTKYPWFKIGETANEVEIRTQQQDGTSNPESLDELMRWENSKYTDKEIHRILENKLNYKRVRVDKDREWFEFPGGEEEMVRVMNGIVTGSKKLNSFPPRPYCQVPAIKQISDYIKDLHSQGIVNLPRKMRRMLLNGKMRVGKCFITYNVAKEVDYKRILILTYKPGGVDESWEDDLDHVYFPNTKFTKASTMESIKFDENFDGIQVIFASFQDAIGDGGNKEKWDEIKNQDIDMLVIDEMHYGSETTKALDVVNSLNHKFTLNLSGTPLKALQIGSYKKNQIYHWTYIDEQYAKRNWDYSLGNNEYEWLPELQIQVMKFDKEFRDSFFKEYSKEELPTMEKIFSKPQLIDLFIERQLWGR